MEQRISIITLGVQNLSAARAFYDALGWQVADEKQASDIVAYNLHAMTLCLYPLDRLADDIGVPAPKAPIMGGVTIAYNVDSKDKVDAALNAADKAGGEIIKKAEDAFWGGYSGYFADPDGHLWEVAFNPFSPLGPNGEFQWSGYDKS